MTTRTPPQLCPACGYLVDAASKADGGDKRPMPGDLTMCMECQEPFQFGEGMVLERVDLDTLENEDPATVAELRHIMTMTRRFKQQQQAKGEWPEPKRGPCS